MSVSGPSDLRHVAALMREQHGPEHERHEMWAAMATWLDNAADAYEPEPEPERGEYTEFIDALRVARAYMAATP